MSQIVVKDGFVIAVCSDNEELYDAYPKTSGWAYFDYAGTVVQYSTINVPTVDVTKVILNEDEDSQVVMTETTVPVATFERAEDPRLTMSLADAKLAVISQLNRITQYEITAQYPVQMQSEITNQVNGYDSTALATMKTFINGKYTTRTTKVNAVNALTTVPDVIAYNVWA